METGDRPIDSKFPHSVPILQDGDSTNNPQSCSQRPVANVPGPERCVLSCTHPRDQQKVSQIPSQRRRLAIQSTPLWTKYRTASIYKGYSPFGCLRSSARGKFSCLPRRLAHQPYVKGRVDKTHRLAVTTVCTPRLGSKSREIRSTTLPSSHLPGDKIRFQDRFSLPSREKNYKVDLPREGIHDRASTASSDMATYTGAPRVPGETSPLRSTTYPSCSTTAQTSLEPVYKSSLSDDSHRREHQGFHQLVDKSLEPRKGGSHGCCSGAQLPVHRQQFQGLGSTCAPTDNLRYMDRSHEGPAHQCIGIEGHMARPSSFCGYVTGLQCCHHVRQCLCHSLHSQPGGHFVTPDVRSRSTSVLMGRVKTNDSITQTSPGTFKCSCRSAQQKKTNSDNRMEPEPVRSGPSVQNLEQTNGRPVCSKTQFQNSDLYVSDPRTGNMESGQSSTVMEGIIRLRVPSNKSDPISTIQDSNGPSRINSDSSNVATPRVVHRSDRTHDRLPKGNTTNSKVAKANILIPISQKPGTAQPSRVEVIARSHQTRGFSQKVSDRISVSQRKSTVQLYEYKWKVFREWCESQGIDPNTPTVPNIADFLLHLFEKGLSTTTIKGYRSSLSALMASRGIDISHDIDLGSLCRGFAIERPISRRETPRWDLMIVLRYLMKPPFEPMRASSTADMTRKTAFLLTLATAKRNSEVWAFSSDVRFGQNKQNATLSFLPGFLAKTQKVDRPETTLKPITLPSLSSTLCEDFPERSLCPVRALLYYTDRTKTRENAQRQKRLFVAFKSGHKGDIVKTTIAGWIKGLIRSAYEQVQGDDVPHLTHTNFQARELRAMATSLAFHQHLSLKQVMEAASWRADGTFAAFYLRDLSPSHMDTNLGPLVAAQAVINPKA